MGFILLYRNLLVLFLFMDIHLEMAFMDVSSYHGGIESSGDIKISMDLNISVKKGSSINLDFIGSFDTSFTGLLLYGKYYF